MLTTAHEAQTSDPSTFQAANGTTPAITSFPLEPIPYPELDCAGFISQHLLPGANYSLRTPTSTHLQPGHVVYLRETGQASGSQYEFVRALPDTGLAEPTSLRTLRP